MLPRAIRDRRGLSLVEILFVLAIMGVMSGMAVMYFEPNQVDQLQAAASTVAMDVEYARQLSVSNNSKYKLTFAPTTNSYHLAHSGTSTALNTLPTNAFKLKTDAADRQTTSLAKLPGITLVELVNAYKLGSTNTVVTDVEFDSLGATTRTETTVIWLRAGTGAGRRFMSITISPITGLTTIDEVVKAMPY